MKYTRKKCLKLWADIVKSRDGYICQVCKEPHPRLNAHHIIDKRYLGFDLKNGISLCPGCHTFSFFSAHRHGIWWANFLKEKFPEKYLYLNNFIYNKEKPKAYVDVYSELQKEEM